MVRNEAMACALASFQYQDFLVRPAFQVPLLSIQQQSLGRESQDGTVKSLAQPQDLPESLYQSQLKKFQFSLNCQSSSQNATGSQEHERLGGALESLQEACGKQFPAINILEVGLTYSVWEIFCLGGVVT